MDNVEGTHIGMNSFTSIYVSVIIFTSLKNDTQNFHTGMLIYHSLSVPIEQISCQHRTRKVWKRSAERRQKTREIRFQKAESTTRYQLSGNLSRCENRTKILAISDGKQ